MPDVVFRPRRLGHINLYVSQLERSIAFYEKTCGIELVRIEAAIRGGFHSNGNTHHDIGLIEISKGVDRIGRDGKVQIAATRGASVGLNHIGWEMENETQLIEAYHRLRDAGANAHRPFDHLISHSIYLPDPDGNMHEFYADVVPDWRQIFNLDHDDLVTSAWDPLAASPLTTAHYPVDPPIREVPDAPIHPRSITGATIATSRFSAMRDFFISTAGLTPATETADGRRVSVFAGAIGRPDLTLVEVPDGEPTGLRMFAFQLKSETGLRGAITNLSAHEANGSRVVESEDRRSVILSDPDGFSIEFYWSRLGEALAPLAA
jgi:catechol 2,3-dioxygenase